MPDPLTLAGVLLVAGALVGAAAASHPALWPVWSAPREAWQARTTNVVAPA
jgi:hypothetical protein